MDKWLVFSGPACPWCVKAKDLLDKNGIEYEVVEIDSREKLLFMQEHAPGMRSVPVIVHNGVVVGGYNALAEYLAK